MEKDIKDLLVKIRELKEKMNKILDDKTDLLDEDVMDLSRMLDKLLNQYEGINKDDDKM